jgi:hypothetical protein
VTRPINCDQVAWMLAAIGRYLPHKDTVQVSRARDLQRYALLYELMEVAGLHFEDDAAASNGTPNDVSMLRLKPADASNAQQMRCEGMTIRGGDAVAGALGGLIREQRILASQTLPHA